MIENGVAWHGEVLGYSTSRSALIFVKAIISCFLDLKKVDTKKTKHTKTTRKTDKIKKTENKR